MTRPGVSAALIVRDEAARLPGCLQALAGLVSAVVVYDTGSTDGTPDLARSLGAHVVEGYWDGDFARARNEALDLVRTPWAVVVDADERAAGDADRLAAALDRAAQQHVEAVACPVRNVRPAGSGGSYEHPGVRLLRVDAARYQGRVHEQPRRRDGGDLRTGAVPQEVLLVVHDGYADAETVSAKARRNADLANAQLADLLAAGNAGNDEAVLHTLLDLGRALGATGRLQDAVDTLETLRSLACPSSVAWQQGSDSLARLLLAAGQDAAVLALAGQLRAAGAPRAWCDWLAAQALVQLGRAGEAAALLDGIDELVDTGARTYDVARLAHARRLVRSLLER